MGWLRKTFKKVGKKLKKFFKSDVGKAIGTIALAVAGFYTFGPAAAGTAGTTAAGTAGTTAAGTAGTTAATTAGTTAATTAGTTAATTTNQIASNVMNTANATTAAGGNPIISPTLSDAVVETINVSGGGETAALESLQAEYSQRGLTTLADATQAEITATSSPTFTSTTAPTSESLLAPEVEFETNLLENSSQLKPSSETLAQRTSTAGAPTLPDPVPEKSPFFSDTTKDYAAQVGVGTATSLLTGAIIGPDEPEDGGGMLVSYDKAEAPAGSYVADISRTYQQNGGMPLTFDMFKNGTVPMYGPSSPRGLATNPYLYAS